MRRNSTTKKAYISLAYCQCRVTKNRGIPARWSWVGNDICICYYPDLVAVSWEKRHRACALRSIVFLAVQYERLPMVYAVAIAQSSQALSQT